MMALVSRDGNIGDEERCKRESLKVAREENVEVLRMREGRYTLTHAITVPSKPAL